MLEKMKKSIVDKFTTVILTGVCVICAVALFINCTLIIKSLTDNDKIPSVGGLFPLVVLSDSMHPKIQSGDLIICKKQEVSDVKIGDIICFYDTSLSSKSLVTHRVSDIVYEDNAIAFRTKGDANNMVDETLVSIDDVAGVYKMRIPLIGHVVLFMQSKVGLIVCSVVPLIGVIVYITCSKKKKEHDIEALQKELDLLKSEYQKV